MKFIVALLLVSSSAFADTSFEKLFDGKFAKCNEAKHVGHRAYLPNALSAKGEVSTLSVSFVLQHLACEQSRDGLNWAPNARPLEPVADQDIYGRPILIKQSDVEAVMIRTVTNRSGESEVLSALDIENGAEQSLKFSVGVNDLLSVNELSAFESGSTVQTRATFFLRSNVSVQTATGETVVLGRRAGGAYTIFISLKKDEDGNLQVLSTQLK